MTTDNDAAVRACESIAEGPRWATGETIEEYARRCKMMARDALASTAKPAPASPESISGFDFWEGGSSGTPAPASPAAEGRP